MKGIVNIFAIIGAFILMGVGGNPNPESSKIMALTGLVFILPFAVIYFKEEYKAKN